MGFKFGGTSFTIGIVEVSLDHVDTEKLTTTTRITFPLGEGKFQIKLYSGKNWQGTRAISFEFEFNQNPPPEEPEEIDDDDYGSEDEEGDDA